MGWFDFVRSPTGNAVETMRIPLFPLSTVLCGLYRLVRELRIKQINRTRRRCRTKRQIDHCTRRFRVNRIERSMQ